ESVYTLGLARHGIRLERGRDVEVLEDITVGEVMQPGATALPEAMPVAEALQQLTAERRQGAAVVDAAGELLGGLTLQDIDRVQLDEERQSLTAGDICTRDVLVTYPDETLGAAMRRMSTRDIGRLPVVAR